MKDRRSIDRYELRLPAKVTLVDVQAEGSEIVTETKDISSSGAFIVTDFPLPKGANMQIEFDLSILKLKEIMGNAGHVRIKVEGSVARTDNDGVAVRFAKDYEIQALEE